MLHRWRMGLLLLALLVVFAWLGFRGVHSTQTAPLGAPASLPASVNQSSTPARMSALHGPTTLATRLSQRVLKYGGGAGEVGMVAEREQTPVGPESFAVRKDGAVMVADVVNHRLAVYSANGAYLHSIPLPGIALGDVTADAQGRVYVYDQVRHSLHQFDTQGTPQSALDLQPKDIDTRGYFHVAGNAVYFADAAARDVLVATLENGVLTPPAETADRRTDGVHGESGRVFSIALEKGQAVRLEVRDPAATLAAQTLEVPLAGVVSARFAGEDQAGRFYVQTERLAGTGIALEVLAFSPTGEQLGTTRMPENDYAIWTAKLVDVGSDGTIVQFLPQRGQAKLNLFAN
jgi:hypothetical protein